VIKGRNRFHLKLSRACLPQTGSSDEVLVCVVFPMRLWREATLARG
jgi:hypothetical protein